MILLLKNISNLVLIEDGKKFSLLLFYLFLELSSLYLRNRHLLNYKHTNPLNVYLIK